MFHHVRSNQTEQTLKMFSLSSSHLASGDSNDSNHCCYSQTVVGFLEPKQVDPQLRSPDTKDQVSSSLKESNPHMRKIWPQSRTGLWIISTCNVLKEK